MLNCYSLWEVEALLSYSLWSKTPAPGGQFQPLDWQLAKLGWRRIACCWWPQTNPQVSGSATTQLLGGVVCFLIFFLTELEGQRITRSHFAFWKHMKSPLKDRAGSVFKMQRLRTWNHTSTGDSYWQAGNLFWCNLQLSALWSYAVRQNLQFREKILK